MKPQLSGLAGLVSFIQNFILSHWRKKIWLLSSLGLGIISILTQVFAGCLTGTPHMQLSTDVRNSKIPHLLYS